MFCAILKSVCQNNSQIIVELKNGLKLEGNLTFVDPNLNLVLSKVHVLGDENVHQFKYTYNTFIRGNVVRYIHFNKKDIDTNLIEEACKKVNENEEND